MSRRGRKRQLDVESRYWHLIQSGTGTVAACQAMGITRKTGYRWRAERGGLPPLALSDELRSNRYLSLLERQRIATLRGQGLGVREIARRMNRAPSTISRELRRNMRPHDREHYDADLAHARTRERTRRTRHSRIFADRELRDEVQRLLELEWSPEQIAQHLRRAHPDRSAWHVCHETIYQALYYGKGGLRRELTKRLRTGRPLRRRRRRADQRRTRFRTPIRLIEHRPQVALERSWVGDWGRRPHHRGAQPIGDRHPGRTQSRFLRLIHLPRGHKAEQLLEALNAVLDTIPATKLLTLTWDQGSEMAHHGQLADRFHDGAFFAHPGSPWMRPTNENTNGLLRQYFHKGSDLAVHEADDLRMVEDRLNNRPRKTLGWATPTEIFHQAVAS